MVLQSAMAGFESSVRRVERFMRESPWSLISGEAQVQLYRTCLAANHVAETRLAETCHMTASTFALPFGTVRGCASCILTRPEVGHGV